MEQGNYAKSEFYIHYERKEDYPDIIRGIADIEKADPRYHPESISDFKHINCIHIRFEEDIEGLEDILKSIEKVSMVERVPSVRIPETDTKIAKDI